MLPYTLSVRGRTRPRGRTAAVVACVLAGVLAVPQPAGAASPHGIEDVSVETRRGFVYGAAWFRDSGAGQSWVHAWIETYSAATGQLTGSLAHKSGVSSCQHGATCYVLLTTSVQATPGECYVVRALSGRRADLVEAQAPAVGRFCL